VDIPETPFDGITRGLFQHMERFFQDWLAGARLGEIQRLIELVQAECQSRGYTRTPRISVRPADRPPRTRVVVVRRGAADSLQALQARFGNDADTYVIGDRRVADRRVSVQSAAVNRRSGQRRFPHDLAVLLTRQFFVARDIRSRAEPR
jgi:hypothetical protein